MYEKLGDLLNEALEKGEIAQEGQSFNVKGQTFNVKGLSSDVPKPSKSNPIGSVIKQEVLFAFNLFGLPTTATLSQVKQKYHYLLKVSHPDTRESSNQNISVDDIKNAYKILEKYLLS